MYLDAQRAGQIGGNVMYIRLDKGIYMVGGGAGGPGISNYKDCNVYLVEGEKDADRKSVV